MDDRCGGEVTSRMRLSRSPSSQIRVSRSAIVRRRRPPLGEERPRLWTARMQYNSLTPLGTKNRSIQSTKAHDRSTKFLPDERRVSSLRRRVSSYLGDLSTVGERKATDEGEK
jgi:hypothetical protein